MHLVKMIVPGYAAETRELSDFQFGPYRWDAHVQAIVDRTGRLRFGYLMPLQSAEADAFVEQLNNFHALWLLAKQSHSSVSNSAV